MHGNSKALVKRSWPISRYYSGTPPNGLKTRIKITVKTT